MLILLVWRGSGLIARAPAAAPLRLRALSEFPFTVLYAGFLHG